MIKSKDIMNYIEGKLNSIAQENNFDIIFNGGVDVVDVDWRRKKFDIDQTPFSLATQNFEVVNGNIEFRYALYIMPFSDDRQQIEFIMEELYSELSNNNIVMIEGWQISTRPVDITYGGDFSEGSGLGNQRFEVLLNFEGYATNYYTTRNLTLKVDGNELPILSLKYDNGKISYINKTSVVESNNAHNLNTNILVIETPLGELNNNALELISSRQKVNIEKEIELKINDNVIIDDIYEFDGFTFATSTSDQVMVAYLYFSYGKDKSFIEINGEQIPILDYAISSKNETLPHATLNSNIVKNLWLGKARAYAFNIAEDNEYEVLSLLYDDLVTENERVPIYNVKINLNGIEFEKSLILDEITKQSKDSANTVLTVTFVESGEF